MNVLEKINQGLFYLDGGTGSWLQERGLLPGELPELWNISRPEMITQLAREYYEAGSNAVLTNTFGANRYKFTGQGGMPSVAKVVKAAVACTMRSRDEAKGELVQEDRYVALDVGPLGKILEPLGDLPFEDAVDAFSEIIRAGADAGVDYIFIETMNDSYETKAAVIAAKESCDLPFFVSNVYDANTRLLTGATPKIMTAVLEGLGAGALGANCSLGPRQMVELVPRFYEAASIPLCIKPNAGLPRTENGKTVYDITPDEFAECMADIVRSGARMIGGCCGTTPEHIRKMVLATRDLKPLPIVDRGRTIVTSYNEYVEFGDHPVLIGERIYPTIRKKFREDLRNGDIDFALDEATEQQDAGAEILNVNVGLPEIDEPAMLLRCVRELQGVTRLPLSLDSSDPAALEGAMRVYNGKPMINSVNGKQEVMDAVFPLVKKYGGLLVCLALDEDGIPQTAEGRLAIAKKIRGEAQKYGISNKDLIFDPLTMAVSAQPGAAEVTLDAVALIKKEMNALTSLGVSNISYGLPQREVVTSAFLVMALERGLSAAIMDPLSADMMKALRSYLALRGMDEGFAEYIGFAGSILAGAGTGPGSMAGISKDGKSTLMEAIIKGRKDEAAAATAELLKSAEPLEVIAGHMIPALDIVSEGYENNAIFLPQLLMSADAAKCASDEVKRVVGDSAKDGPKVVLATVKGDIHDIGKNIVRILLENYGFTVIDLGKDVAPEAVVEAVASEGVGLVGLSALLTTTAPAMEETISLLRKKCPGCKVVVGGAVITQEYADMIGADCYAEGAMDTVRYAEKILRHD